MWLFEATYKMSKSKRSTSQWVVAPYVNQIAGLMKEVQSISVSLAKLSSVSKTQWKFEHRISGSTVTLRVYVCSSSFTLGKSDQRISGVL